MAFSRKFIKKLGIDDETSDILVEEHTTAMKEIAKERDELREQVDTMKNKLATAEQRVTELTAQAGDAKDGSGNSYKALYEAKLAEEAANAAKAAKESAFRAWLTENGAQRPEFVDTLCKLADYSKVEVEGGKAKTCDYLDGFKLSYAWAFGKVEDKGLPGFNPPGGAGGAMTKEAYQKMTLEQRMQYEHTHPGTYAKFK